jgi:Holliday junction resolvasome RuvABC endonuclease subunit
MSGVMALNMSITAVASNNGPEVTSVSVTYVMKNVESQLGLIEGNGSAQIVNDKKGSNTVQHSGSTKPKRPRTRI